MLISIFHAPNNLVSELSMGDTDHKAQIVRENFTSFKKVLQVPFQDYTLDDFYRYTQNLEEPWTMKFEIPENYRSTSVGDVFLVGDKAFMVDSFGFCQLEGLV